MKPSLKPATLAAPLILLLLAGCDNDKPNYGPSQPTPVAQAAPDAGQDTPVSDPLHTPETPTDPLLNGTGAGQVASDPLLSSNPLGGRPMPTKHSHWLRGHLRNARLTVLLNSARLGTYYGPVDKDITMRLHKGLNLVTFVYEPRIADASAQMRILESEHNPPIAPLVNYRVLPAPDETKPKPVTQTFRFNAN